MLYEDVMDMFMLYKISPELTCQCDEVHECQQCYEERKEQQVKPQVSTSDKTDMSMPEWYDFE